MYVKNVVWEMNVICRIYLSGRDLKDDMPKLQN